MKKQMMKWGGDGRSIVRKSSILLCGSNECVQFSVKNMYMGTLLKVLKYSFDLHLSVSLCFKYMFLFILQLIAQYLSNYNNIFVVFLVLSAFSRAVF